MIEWFNANAGAVQGLAALAVTILTALLAFLTYRYVRLTGTIANAAKEQVELARLQASVSSSLAEAAKEQRALNQQRLDEAKSKEEADALTGKRELDRLAARLLTQLSGASTEPELEYFMNSSPISEEVLNSVKQAATQAREPKTGQLESAIASLEAIAALQSRVVGSSPRPYTFSSSERESYKTNLRNARAELQNFTLYRPKNERY